MCLSGEIESLQESVKKSENDSICYMNERQRRDFLDSLALKDEFYSMEFDPKGIK